MGIQNTGQTNMSWKRFYYICQMTKLLTKYACKPYFEFSQKTTTEEIIFGLWKIKL